MKTALLICMALSSISWAQTPNATATPPLPLTSAIRKTVTYIDAHCKKGNQDIEEDGTGFFVAYPDERLGKDGEFVYLVTNRHVALCTIDGHSYPVEKISIRLNLKSANRGEFSETVPLKEHWNAPWLLPTDDSVDLAALPLLPPQDRYDFLAIPLSLFATKDVIEREKITEGDRILFTGLFYRLPGEHRMKPIIREGTLAMLPEDKIVTTTGKLGWAYVADVHVMGGNSGSPVMVNLGGLRGNAITAGDRAFFLGVVSGFYTEDENLNLRVTTSYRGTIEGNSGLSVVVPADEVKALLEQPDVQSLRDTEVRAKTGR